MSIAANIEPLKRVNGHHARRPDRTLPVQDLAEILRSSASPRVWHVGNGWIPGNDVTLFAGDGGQGKTQVAFQLAMKTASGGDWCGLPVRGGAVVFVTAEEPVHELHVRAEDIRRAGGWSAPAQPLKIISLADRDAVLAVPGEAGMQPTELLVEIEHLVQTISAKLLVLDAAADMFGGDEIQRWQVRGFFRLLRAIAIRHECAVLLLAHPSVDGMRSGRGYSGSTAWNNSARSRLFMTTPTRGNNEVIDPNLREIVRAKSNRSSCGSKLLLRWTEGAFTSAGGSAAGILTSASAKQAFMESLRAYTLQGRNLSHQRGPSYAPALLAADPASGGLSARAYATAMNELFAEHRIKVEQYGRPSRPYARLAEVADEALL